MQRLSFWTEIPRLKQILRYSRILSIPAVLLIFACNNPSTSQENPADYVRIAYNGGPLNVQASTTSAIIPRDVAIVPSGAVGNVTYSIDPSLPGELVLNLITGTVSGTPTRVSAAKTYTIKATGKANTIYQGFTASTTISIEVTPADLFVRYLGTFKDVTNGDPTTYPQEQLTLANLETFKENLENNNLEEKYYTLPPLSSLMLSILSADEIQEYNNYRTNNFPMTTIGTWPTGQDGTSEASAYRLNLQHADENLVLRPIVGTKLGIDLALLKMQYAITPPLPAGLSFTVISDGTRGSAPGKIVGNPTNTTGQAITSMHTITATAGAGTIYEGREKKVYIEITIDP